MHKHILLSSNKSRGFSLLEVLVTFVVLSIGLLGLAALHANGLKNNQSAYWRSQATILAYSILDSMRTNRAAALNEDYDIALNTDPPGGTSVAVLDLTTWKNTLQSSLPTGDGSVDCDGGTSICEVIVQWDDSLGEAGSNTQQFSIITQL
jgi:type IV pilus assembly protein PilV